MIEVGVPGFISDTWNAISAPPKTPAPIIAKLNKAMNDVISASETKKRFADLDLIAVGGTPEDMRKLIQEETARWTDVIKKAGHSAGVKRQPYAMISGVSWSSIKEIRSLR